MRYRRPPTPVDWLVAAVVALFAVAEEASGRPMTPSREHFSLWIAAGGVAAVGVLFQRRAPFTILAVYSAANVAMLALSWENGAAWQFYTQLVLLFTLLSEVGPRSAKAAAGLAATGVYVTFMILTASPPAGWGGVAVALAMCAIAAGAGLAVRRHRVLAVQAAERGELLAREAVSHERARIARELHDIVAHSVSVMTLQTAGVRLTLPEDRERDRRILATVEETGRGALEELHRMLGLLRGPQADEPPRQVGLHRLDELLEQVRSAGLDVTLDTQGDPVPLPAGLDLSAYRIVQEALTNTLKHAGPTQVTVSVAYDPGQLRLEILDRGPRETRAQAGTSGNGGHGLIGMRERVALFQGTFTAAPLPSGGFGVRAVLPL
ncbi:MULTISPECIES: sensor histidine kinase [Streptosporangium]|uniref:histidine kinase n=1 Tax=Streptosporangium brasiliense TaxID=47480 RepID=A0ABT9R1N4_9ACTN|nr:sensor histidine kinase [Streptosporangium brasiliense]MDP9863148.1 signal transduction histidine kinase [Streptosporangium brasiliense]